MVGGAMHIRSAGLLEAIFAMKGNLAQGLAPPTRVVSGVEIAPFKGNAAAAVCISADFEMGWGWRSRGLAGATAMGDLERRHVPLIVDLLDQYSIPITWATIGHLFLHCCTRSDTGLAHPSMPRPKSDGTWTGDWYWPDPCSSVLEAPAWYAPDVIQRILDARVPHEIGTHSFSHINFQAPYSTPEVVERELESCIDAMKPFRLRPHTLIFPRHQAEYAYLPQLARAGIVAVRHRDRRIRLSYPERTKTGIYKIYESMNLRIARHYDYLEKIKLFVGKAMERRAAYALWFHPSDPPEWFDPQLRVILEYLAAERSRGRLWITTMRELAAYCEAREQLALRVERREDSMTITFESMLDTSKYGTPVVTLLVAVPRNPMSVRLGFGTVARTLTDARMAPDGSARALINVPVTAKTVQFGF
jgi:peptidoglycan/xylan/chitin deacetylase (PgdA/CDA1 family)